MMHANTAALRPAAPPPAPSRWKVGDVVYAGNRDKRGAHVSKVTMVDTPHTGGVISRLNPRTDLFNHSPTGFEWSYGGSGPAQLALAMCCDALANDDRAIAVYQRFKWLHVASFAKDSWQLSANEVRLACAEIERAKTL